MKNKTWILVKKPKNKRIVGCRWIFRRKHEILVVELARFKAQVVAKGTLQLKVWTIMKCSLLFSSIPQSSYCCP